MFTGSFGILTRQEVEDLPVGSYVDHRTSQKGCFKYYFAKIVNKKGTKVEIAYIGLSKKWNVWCDVKKDYSRFASAGRVSRRPSIRYRQTIFKLNDCVYVYPRERSRSSKHHKDWFRARIDRIDKHSAQIRVVYQCLAQQQCKIGHKYWTHLDNIEEVYSLEDKNNMNAVPSAVGKNMDEEKNPLLIAGYLRLHCLITKYIPYVLIHLMCAYMNNIYWVSVLVGKEPHTYLGDIQSTKIQMPLPPKYRSADFERTNASSTVNRSLAETEAESLALMNMRRKCPHCRKANCLKYNVSYISNKFELMHKQRGNLIREHTNKNKNKNAIATNTHVSGMNSMMLGLHPSQKQQQQQLQNANGNANGNANANANGNANPNPSIDPIWKNYVNEYECQSCQKYIVHLVRKQENNKWSPFLSRPNRNQFGHQWPSALRALKKKPFHPSVECGWCHSRESVKVVFSWFLVKIYYCVSCQLFYEEHKFEKLDEKPARRFHDEHDIYIRNRDISNNNNGNNNNGNNTRNRRDIRLDRTRQERRQRNPYQIFG